jgi:hypothetical protein
MRSRALVVKSRNSVDNECRTSAKAGGGEVSNCVSRHNVKLQQPVLAMSLIAACLVATPLQPGTLAHPGGLAGAGAVSQNGESYKAQMTIRADQPGGTISRNIYGSFSEHLGSGIYDGIWVGEDSAIPNTRGIRNDVIAALKSLNLGVLGRATSVQRR